jgi:protein TonB
MHMLLLWPDALPRSAEEGGRPLQATLRAAAVVLPETHTVIPMRPEPAHPAPPQGSAPRLAAIGTAAEIAQTALPAPVIAPEQVALAGSAAVTAVEGPVHATEAGLVEGDGLRAYRIGLAREARAHKRYPPLARERGWSGTAEVRIDVSPEGKAGQVLIARSSGHEVLDREALHMMSRAAAAASLPESLRGRAFAVSLPVVFDLGEAP